MPYNYNNLRPGILTSAAHGAAQSNVATLAPGVATQLAFLQGFDVTGGGATGASIIEIVVTGLLGGTMWFEMAVVAGAGVQVNPQGGFFFSPPEPIPASGLGVSIVITVPSFGAGNTNAAVVAFGFQEAPVK
jgi:hypothetical protein